MLGRLLGSVVACGALIVSMAAAATADEVDPVAIAWDALRFGTEAQRAVTISGTLAVPEQPEGEPAPVVTVERRGTAGGWTPVAVTVSATAFSARVPGENAVYRARLSVAGQVVEAGTTEVLASPAASTLGFTMPSALKDYRKATVAVRWKRGFDGAGISGKVALEFRRAGTKAWKKRATVTVVRGSGSVRITPRDDGRFRVRWAGSAHVGAVTSSTRRFDNRPPGAVVTIPKGASKPSLRLPAQPRAARKAADARIRKLSDAMWSSMKGRSWHSGCPVGRAGLRVVRVSYWAFDGYLRRGEIVVNASVARRTARIFTDLFRTRVPIRSMYRVDRFGYNASLRGADDLRSMRADNTSGFNCRRVVGRTHLLSPHATGRSIDINPWENPYRVGDTHYPNGSWQRRSKPASITWRGPGDPVVKVFRKHGFRWLGASDLHHFQRS